MTTDPDDARITFLGAGNMAGALLDGLLRAGTCKADRVCATDVRPERLRELEDRHGISTGDDNAAAARWADVVVLATKPQTFDRLLPDIAESVGPRTLVLSIAAGIPIAAVESYLTPGTRVVRAMPNTPALVGAGATAVTPGTHATSDDVHLACRLFESVGIALAVDEPSMNAVTGVSGSGPAYMFVIMESLADAGVRAGLPRETAQRLAAQTMFGAAKLQIDTGEHPGRLKDRVTSPGGTTIAALHMVERGGVRATLIDAVQAAATRAGELGAEIARKLVHG